MTKSDVARIMSATAKVAIRNVTKGSFAAKRQSAAAKNVSQKAGKKLIFSKDRD